MLCRGQAGSPFSLELSNIKIKELEAIAHWEARYIFSKTGREVNNIVDAEFVFKEGKIIRHIDYFDMENWERQALGK